MLIIFVRNINVQNSFPTNNSKVNSFCKGISMLISFGKQFLKR